MNCPKINTCKKKIVEFFFEEFCIKRPYCCKDSGLREELKTPKEWLLQYNEKEG